MQNKSELTVILHSIFKNAHASGNVKRMYAAGKHLKNIAEDDFEAEWMNSDEWLALSKNEEDLWRSYSTRFYNQDRFLWK